MKTLIIALLCMSFNSFAQNHSKKELIQMSVDRLFPDGVNKVKVDMSDIVAEWNKVFDAQNLKSDYQKGRVDWNRAFPIKKNRVHKITGKRTYYGLFPKNYRYEIHEDADLNRLVVKVKLHFYPSNTYIRRMEKLHAINDPDKKYYPKLKELALQVKENVAQTETAWNAQAPKNVAFRFELVEKAKADYSIKLVTFFGAMYDKFIIVPAYSDILSHEIGHMMGLDDEYSPVTSNALPVNSLLESMNKRYAERNMDYTAYKDMRCNLESIMCLKGTLYKYHFDHILGRIKLK